MRRLALALVLAAAGAPAVAADCPLMDAIYREPGGYEIAFHPVAREDELAVTNTFELVTPDGNARLVGHVTWGNGYTRPIGRLTYGCPDGEQDEEAAKACTHWSGIVYGVTGSTVEMLGGQEANAPDQIVLSNLGQTLNYSLFPSLAGERGVTLDDMPWDVFAFIACAP